MNILLYSPDNGVMRNFTPHLWMFLLQSLTPPEHEVFLIDGNAQPMTEDEVAEFVRKKDIRLVGIRREALRRISHRPLSEHAVVFFARPAFRGIYFPQMRRRQWFSLLWSNRQVLMSLSYEAFQETRTHRRGSASPSQETA